MSNGINIGRSHALAVLLSHAEKVITDKGMYYHFPCWFEQKPDNFEFIIHYESDLPDDLGMFLCRAHLGGDNPQPEGIHSFVTEHKKKT